MAAETEEDIATLEAPSGKGTWVGLQRSCCQNGDLDLAADFLLVSL